MSKIFDVINALTTSAPSTVDKSTLLKTFANELGWTPSYNLSPAIEKDFVNIHLVVEHGLENSAVLTFLNKPFYSLEEKQRRDLLNISYNNLVDWHIHIDNERATYIYNRNTPPNNVIEEQTFRNDYYDALRSDAFEKLVGKKLSPNIPSLDEALINTISHWKRIISSELNNEVDNLGLSTLFNSIIFIRALEDNIKRYNNKNIGRQILFESLNSYNGKKNFTGLISKAQELLGKGPIPSYLIDAKLLTQFDKLDRQLISNIIGDFYQNRITGFYNYDFSIMSKHALSRIYERYSALLKVEESDQLTLFPRVPNEEPNKAYGAIYTPEYVARFFSRYLENNLSPKSFDRIKIAEPSVGSGIFLRTLLELKCDPTYRDRNSNQIKDAFENILGIDVDGNACQAAKLSLALLQLVLVDEFPKDLNIVQAETIDYLNLHPEIKGTFDAVLSNPPFIATELLSKELKQRISSYLGEHGKGRTDSYLAFLKAGVELLKPGGFGLYVVPHSFLISDSGSKLREYIYEQCWIRCLADLSAIPVFGTTGIYVILLVFQKKNTSKDQPMATIIKCREFVGKALLDGLNNKFVDNKFYSVFEVNQIFFKEPQWNILPFKEILLNEKISKCKPLKEFLEVRQGFVTGADDIFIFNKSDIPDGEKDIYIPYLPDRKIDRYLLPKQSLEFVFYPYLNGEKVTEAQMKREFPKTWKYLKSKEKLLKSKKSFANSSEWWRPLRTRQPEHMLIPKLITPHLTLTPKFSIDSAGRFGISRSPFLISKVNTAGEKDMLLYFLAVLNSTPCYWYIANHSHKYSRGYSMIEVKTLAETPVPDPSEVPVTKFKTIVSLVNQILKANPIESRAIESQIDLIVCDLYNLNDEERQVLGIDYDARS